MNKITFSAPGKIHLLGEHAVVYGKPAIIAAVGLRVTVTVTANDSLVNTSEVGFDSSEVRKIIEPIVKKYLKIKTIPSYKLSVSSQFPTGVGLGSSAAVSAAYIAALLTFLKAKWDKALVNELTYQAEKTFHGNPSGGDNSTVVFGGLIWFTRTNFEKQNLNGFRKGIAKNFILINTGKPKESTKEMVGLVKSRVKSQESRVKKIFDDQEQLVKELLTALQEKNEDQLIQVIRAGEKNLETMGVVSPYVKAIIREVENKGGAAKVCGGGGKAGPTGVLLCYHPNPSIILNVAKSYNLDYFQTALGTEGLKQE